MKTLAILAITSLALAGCNQRQMDDPAGAQKDQIEQSKDAQQSSLNQEKKNIEDSADQAKDQISDQAKAEKQKVEAQSEAQKAQIDAEKKQVEAQAKAEKTDVDAQYKIDEAAGASTTTPANYSHSANSSLAKTVQATLNQENPSLTGVTIMESNGKVTLRGTVRTAAEKRNLEQQAKAVSGVTSVDNQLEVKAD